jgi:hypothetical protein
MFSAIKIINSKNKRNIRFVAAGSFQIELFENEGHDYFTIYKFNYGSEGRVQYYLINLASSVVAQVSDKEFQLIQGSSTYKVRVNSTNNCSVFVSRYLWGWLPISRFGGKASNTGIATLKSNLTEYANDLAA